jgi:DNA-binding Xre family transcriptional regulator
MDHKLKLTNVIKDCELSSTYVTKINNDQNIEIFTLAKICKRLGIDIGDACKLKEE